MGLRLFVAARLSPAAHDHLLRFIEPRLDSDDRLRWVPPHQWHLTTAFFDHVEPGCLDELTEELAASVQAVEAFTAAITGGGFFGRPEAARVLWLGVAPGAESLARLSRRTRNAANRVGVVADGADFTAHLTLARARVRLEVGRWLEILDTYSGPEFEISELELICSQLSASGASHRTLTRLSLGRPAGDGQGVAPTDQRPTG